MAPPASKGYDKLAALMACDPGSAIYRRFAKLNAKNILYLQAEISHVENELKDIIMEDDKSPEKATYPFSVRDMKEEDFSLQWKKVLEARDLLNEYNTALLQQAQLLRFSNPEKPDLDVFKEWLRREAAETRELSPPGQWDEENEKDLVALRSRHEGKDSLTRWVYTRVIPWYHEQWGHKNTKRQDSESGVYTYDDEVIELWTYLIGLLISGFLPAVAVFVFYFVRDTAGREAAILFYNMAFVLTMGWMFKAKRADMFFLASAFAAEQVATIMTTQVNHSSR
ncbi:hypothetical protein BO78DRAFT_441830 [Aspergillus sclerotiicarbonarius CBS 121057]|uniref:DUF6594 domain-containing protein n=1 Tax=Aspergillus sclerotiicarbonarius (strain CBS 121057 / IBT 28362) TaxID=1448318 RepID=A0A319ENN2_ASPSB|nr:hypothetical protein BO78DRAFT_441830 [Aspergillus sclerotiicarbonarius CBS 121057]